MFLSVLSTPALQFAATTVCMSPRTCSVQGQVLTMALENPFRTSERCDDDRRYEEHPGDERQSIFQ